MGDMITMDVLHSVDYLLEIETCLVLRNALVLHVLIQLTFVRQFHDHKNVVGGV